MHVGFFFIGEAGYDSITKNLFRHQHAPRRLLSRTVYTKASTELPVFIANRIFFYFMRDS